MGKEIRRLVEENVQHPGTDKRSDHRPGHDIPDDFRVQASLAFQDGCRPSADQNSQGHHETPDMDREWTQRNVIDGDVWDHRPS